MSREELEDLLRFLKGWRIHGDRVHETEMVINAVKRELEATNEV